MPIRQMIFSFDDLSEEAEEEVLYGGDKTDVMIRNPVNGWQRGIWKGRSDSLRILQGRSTVMAGMLLRRMSSDIFYIHNVSEKKQPDLSVIHSGLPADNPLRETERQI